MAATTTPTLKEEIEQFAANRPESELRVIIGELVKRAYQKKGDRKGVVLQDGDGKPVGFLLTDDAFWNPDLSDYQTQLAVTRYRIENPPERYLTPEEFIGNFQQL